MTKELVIVRKATWDDSAVQDAVNKITPTMQCGCEECMTTLKELTGALHDYVSTVVAGYSSDWQESQSLVKLATWSGRVSQHMLAVENAVVTTEEAVA